MVIESAKPNKASRESAIKDRLKINPADPIFPEYAEALRRKKRYLEAIEVCGNGLSKNSACYHGRLVLARVYCDLNWEPFAIKELEIIHRELPHEETVILLLKKLSPDFRTSIVEESIESNSQTLSNQTQINQTIVAEIDFDMGELELDMKNH
jgi:hypothetical protein